MIGINAGWDKNTQSKIKGIIIAICFICSPLGPTEFFNGRYCCSVIKTKTKTASAQKGFVIFTPNECRLWTSFPNFNVSGETAKETKITGRELKREPEIFSIALSPYFFESLCESCVYKFFTSLSSSDLI